MELVVMMEPRNDIPGAEIGRVRASASILPDYGIRGPRHGTCTLLFSYLLSVRPLTQGLFVNSWEPESEVLRRRC